MIGACSRSFFIYIMSITLKSILLILAVLILDQLFKILVKTHMVMGQEIHVIGNWFLLHFTENNGMAFGMNLPGNNSKIFLSIFRILAVTGIFIYLRYLILNKAQKGLIIAISFIFAGAVGNIIDSLFYGMIFEESWGGVSTLFPEGGGYASFLQGRVVDMLYFPIIRTTWPEWFPGVGGSQLVFFRPVFNIADSSITTGVAIILIFQKRLIRIKEE